MKAVTYEVIFNGNGRNANGEPCLRTGDKAKAIACAKQEAHAWSGHVDFAGGQFDVVESDEDGNGRVIFSARIA